MSSGTLGWRGRSVLLLLVALLMFAMCVRQARTRHAWAPWLACGVVFLALGARKPRQGNS